MSSERPPVETPILTGAGGAQTPVSPFLCPGSTQSIARALHLARLNAAWPTCDQCEWRHDTEGLAEKTISVTERIRDQRVTGIQRTEFGIRGQYLNELDRRTTSELARVFCSCLHENARASDQRESMEANLASDLRRHQEAPSEQSFRDIKATMAKSLPVVVGYDGRHCSPDIFVGVTAAVREFGLPIIDIGRSTAASIQEAARSLAECSGAVFVTGSGTPSSWTGLDISDVAGDPIPVVWKDFGVRLQHVSLAESERNCRDGHSENEPDDRLSDMLHRMRSAGQRSPASATPKASHLRLLLPALENRSRWLARLSRHSGTHQVLDFEPAYRQWLKRWYPDKYAARVQVRSDDALIQQRVAWLSQHTQLEFIGRSRHDVSSIPPCQMTLTVEEDDRHFTLENSLGVTISADRLAALINVAIHSQASQVTAHTDAASGRFWLTDANRSGTSRTTEHVRDALALLGLTIKLMSTGRMQLH